MNNKLLFIIVGVMFLASCDGRKPKIYDTTDAISVEITKPETVNISDITESIEFVKLDMSSKEALMTHAHKIRVYDNKIYAMDPFGAKGIIIFDTSGKHLKSIRAFGRGPNEYLELTDFEIDYVNEELIVGDRVSRKLLFYDLDGNFKRKLDVEWLIQEVAVLPDGNVVRGGTYRTEKWTGGEKYDSYLISIFDPSGQKNLGEHIKSRVQVNYFLVIRDYLTSDFKGNITFGTQGDDIIYSVTSEGCTPKYLLDWKIPHLDPSEFDDFDESTDFLRDTNNTDETYFLGTHNESSDFLLLSLDFGKPIYTLYSKKNNTSQTFEIKNKLLLSTYFDEEGFLWSEVTIPHFVQMSGDTEFIDRYDKAGIKEGDVVLCKLKFKS